MQLAWTDIQSITKRSVVLLFDSAVCIVTMQKDYVFATLQRDKCYFLLEQLWVNRIARLAETVASRSERGVERSTSSTSSRVEDSSRAQLESTRHHQHQRRALHLPSDEPLLDEFSCQLWVPKPRQGYVHGTYGRRQRCRTLSLSAALAALW